jgi:hypothetical protein
MGTTLLPGYEANLRNDLKDLDSTNYLWQTTELDRHVAHAVNDYSRIVPLQASINIVVVSTSTPGPVGTITRRQTVPGPPVGYLWTERVEYPIDDDPPSYLPFREEFPNAGTLYFPSGDPPNAGDELKIWYALVHTLNGSTSTILQEHEELIELGAVAYATQAASRYAQNRLNASAWTPRGIQLFATERMAAYLAELNAVRDAYQTPGVPLPQWGQVASDWFEV